MTYPNDPRDQRLMEENFIRQNPDLYQRERSSRKRSGSSDDRSSGITMRIVTAVLFALVAAAAVSRGTLPEGAILLALGLGAFARELAAVAVIAFVVLLILVAAGGGA